MSGIDGNDTRGSGRRVTRRRLLASVGTAGAGLLAGCPGGFGGSGGSSTPTERPTEAPTPTPTATPTTTPTPTPTPDPVVWEDDFERGTLADYEVQLIEGGDDTAGFSVTSQPSLGSYALTHQTEARILYPSEAVSLDPPVTAWFDVYVDGLSGLDFLLQWNQGSPTSYRVDVRRNANGGFLRVRKAEGTGHLDIHGIKKDTVGKAGPDVVEQRRWQRVVVHWTGDTVEAGLQSADERVSISDDDGELRGNSFALLGYHHSGFTAVDNFVVRSGDHDVPSLRS